MLHGRGFGLIRGLPVDDFGKRAAAIAFCAVGQDLGDDVLSQNKHGHVLGHVTDIGEYRSNPSQRGPYSREEIPFHVDCSDIVGLLCMEVSKFGGESSLVSSVAVYNEML
ncbi:MAG: TauD/TfdA family dioxygenase, partial [Pseudomonadota bacterium]|nr:TauD/TfdA family dioxygenase [Pseudomonadota bacterium]